MDIAKVEKIKATASFLNSIASSSVVASVITPAIGLSIGVIEITSINVVVVSTACAFWFVIAYILHLLALRQLDRLE